MTYRALSNRSHNSRNMRATTQRRCIYAAFALNHRVGDEAATS